MVHTVTIMRNIASAAAKLIAITEFKLCRVIGDVFTIPRVPRPPAKTNDAISGLDSGHGEELVLGTPPSGLAPVAFSGCGHGRRVGGDFPSSPPR